MFNSFANFNALPNKKRQSINFKKTNSDQNDKNASIYKKATIKNVANGSKYAFLEKYSNLLTCIGSDELSSLIHLKLIDKPKKVNCQIL